MTPIAKKPPNKYLELEQVLRSLREQLAKRLHGHRVEAVPERLPEDLGGEATRSLLSYLTFETVERERTTLRQIELALARLRAGTYGICQNCGTEISLERLRAVPWARFCLPCEQESERTAAD
jgi:DnaK suppressor protein